MRLLWILLAILGAGLVLLVANNDAGTTAGFANDDFAGLVSLGALALLFGAGVLGSGIGLGRAARQAALWVAILLALVSGYEYRHELQDVASRVTAGLVPGSPLSRISADGQLRVMVSRSGGHFEVEGAVNGSSERFIIDTGASTIVLTDRAARRAGFDAGSLDYSVRVQTANGTARAAPVRLDVVEIGGISRNGLTALVAEPGRLGDSLLGMNFLDTLSGYEVRGDRFTMID